MIHNSQKKLLVNIHRKIVSMLLIKGISTKILHAYFSPIILAVSLGSNHLGGTWMNLMLGLAISPSCFLWSSSKVYWKNSKEQRNTDKDVGRYVRECVCALLYIHNSEHLTTSMPINRKVVKENTGHWYNEMPQVLKRMRQIQTCWCVKMIAMYCSRDGSKFYIYKYLGYTETGNRSHPWDDSVNAGGHSLFLLNTWVLQRGYCRRKYSENGLFWTKVKLEMYICIF